MSSFVSAWVAVFSVYGPDCFFFTCCTFIQLHFLRLQHDMEQIVKEDAWNRPDITLETFKAELVQIVNKHRELMRYTCTCFSNNRSVMDLGGTPQATAKLHP